MEGADPIGPSQGARELCNLAAHTDIRFSSPVSRAPSRAPRCPRCRLHPALARGHSSSMPKVVSRSAVSSSTDGQGIPFYVCGAGTHAETSFTALPTASSTAALRVYCEISFSSGIFSLLTSSELPVHPPDCICSEFIVRLFRRLYIAIR